MMSITSCMEGHFFSGGPAVCDSNGGCSEEQLKEDIVGWW